MIAQCCDPEKKMWFINIIAAVVNQVYIISRQVHPQCNIGVVAGVIIHQRNKEPGDVYECQ